MSKVGAVLVVGGGIGGMQSALDLADSGFKVYLLDKRPSIGGTMAQLDKTFPTNDCSMCIMAPKLVTVSRHPNIDILAYSELVSVKGTSGDFKVKIKKKPRYVHMQKCTGCGKCAEKCPSKVPNEFEMGTGYRKAIYILFPQAVPLKYSIDSMNCLYFKMKKKGKEGVCMLCSKVCEADAIDYQMEEEEVILNVGSIIITTGVGLFDPTKKPEYGYDRFQNVITSLELERFLSASGPTNGQLIRPSDGETPNNIAFIQCVGSRDQRTNSYCSSVCCTYAIKEAIIAQEHTPGLKSYIFSVDVRTFGRGFEDFRNRAEKEYGVKIIKNSRIPTIEETVKSNLLIKYIEGEEIKEEEFDMVILSIGLEPPNDAKSLAEKLGVELNEYGFCSTELFEPLSTSKPGVFVGGVFSGPKDIPDTVVQASGAAAKASSIIASKRNSLVKEKEYPKEIDVTGQEPQVGVFICHCGVNISSVVDVPAVVEYVKTLPNVVFVAENLYTCSQDTQKIIKDIIKQHKLNRLVVASCSPRTHEPLFQDTIREAGLNRYLFEMANIRDQCSWVHMHQPEEATEKAKVLVRMAVTKAALYQPLEKREVSVTPSALVIGGGLAGMRAALEISKQGFKVDIVEKTDSLGGLLRHLNTLLGGEDPRSLLKNLVDRIEMEEKVKERITVHTSVEVENVDGYVGNFKSTLTDGTIIEHGIIIVASGAVEYKPTEYLYGKNPNVKTLLEYEQGMAKDELKPQSVAIIHCVGARTEENPGCSRICCSNSMKIALEIKKKHPKTDVYILYKDIRTYGFKEKYYQEAAEKGVVFIRYNDDDSPIVSSTDGCLEVLVRDEFINREILLKPDILVLNAATVPNPDNSKISKLLKVPLGKDGFFLEAHVKLRPLDFATDGIFLCGLAHSPRFVDETIAMANAAAARAMTILSKRQVKAESIISVVDPDKCRGCGDCETVCEFGTARLVEVEPGVFKSEINEVLCKGCGSCVATCCNGAITSRHFRREQILKMIESAIGEEVTS